MQLSSLVWCLCLTETLKRRAGRGFAFWISNLKVSCFMGCVGSRTWVSLSGKKGKMMFEERWQSGGRQPHLHSLGHAQSFSRFCYCKTTEEQNFSANESCFSCLSSGGNFREGIVNHIVRWLSTFRENFCPVPDPACGRSKTVMLFCIISGNGGMC